jgi:hypothetical protein
MLASKKNKKKSNRIHLKALVLHKKYRPCVNLLLSLARREKRQSQAKAERGKDIN